ncbi:MAG: H-NS histone family protein [Rhodobacteraceae bacterium]|nr:H-NS histone family protein [Paracoccaceae bacterium]
MKIDLAGLSKAELQKLQADVEKALSNIDQKKKEDAKKAAEEAAKKFGFSLDELVGKTRGKAAKVSAAKYRNPANPKQTWTGRGRQPGWIKDGLAKGKKLAEFAI